MSSTQITQSVPVIDDASPGRKAWSAGTLTYTVGALVVLFCWLLWGDFVLQLKERSVPASLQLLLKKFQATDTVNSVLIGMLPQAMGLILVPVISYRSDRYRSRWGRRIPYLLLPTPLAVLSMVGLAYAPPLGRWVSGMSGTLLTPNQATVINLGIFWTLFELASIVCDSVFIALINDVVPHKVIGRFFALFRMFSLAAAIFYSWSLMGKIEEYYQPIFLGIGLLYGFGFGAMCFFVKEGEYPRPDDNDGKPRSLPEAVRIYLRESFTNSYYAWIFFAISAAFVAFQPIILFYIYLGKSLGMDADSIGKQLATPMYICSFILGFPIGWLCDKIHPTRMVMLATLVYGLAALVAFFVIHSPGTFITMQILCGVLAGVWSTAYNPFLAVLFPKSKFASFLSALNIIRSLALMATAFVAGLLLDYVLKHEYRYVYLWGFIFCMVSLALQLVVYKKFKEFGGVKGYIAP